MTRKLYVKSYGCQMNVYDSHRMADTLAPAGYNETTSPEDADLVILNTCHIREKAAEKVYSEIGRIREMKEVAARDGRRMLIAVAGCVAQAEGREIIRRAGAVDLVVGSQNYHRLPEMVARAQRGEKVIDTDFPVEDKFEALAAPKRDAIAKRGISAFVTVQEGCDKFCTFCVVPFTRGRERGAERIQAGGLGRRQRRGAFTVKLDKFPDHFLTAEQLCDVQDKIGRGNAFTQLPAHVHAHHFRRQKVNWLAEHAGFRFDSAYAPADHAETVDHGRVRIGPDESIGEVNS